jgi:hypothetical protein
MSINGLLNQQITIASKTGYNTYGREVAGASTTVQSRFQKTNKQRLLPNGSMITIVATVYVPSDTVVVIDDKVTYDGVDYKVYGIYTAVDGTGNTHHLKLELTQWKAA